MAAYLNIQSLGLLGFSANLPESPPLYTDMTVEGYLHFVARIKAVPRAEIAEATDQVLATCDQPSCLARGRSDEEALTRLRAEIRYRIEWCPCTGVEDEYVQKAVTAIQQGARTGHPGDGRIFVIPFEDAYRIRTRELE